MSDIHALSGAYAVDALDQLERVAFERHLGACATCHSEVEGLREAASLFAELAAYPPPGAMRDRVLAEIARVRPLPPIVTPVSNVRPLRSAHRRQPRRSMAALVAAAAAVVAIGGGVVIATQTGDDSSQAPTELSALQQVQRAPDAETFKQNAVGGGTVTVVVSKSLNKAVLATKNLAAAPAGHTHELWLRHNNVMIPAGYLRSGGNNEIVLDGDPASAQAFGITIEPVSGATSPSDQIVSLFNLKKA